MIFTIKPIHLKGGTPGMVYVRLGHENEGHNTALEPEEAVKLAGELIAAAAIAETFGTLEHDAAERLARASKAVEV